MEKKEKKRYTVIIVKDGKTIFIYTDDLNEALSRRRELKTVDILDTETGMFL